MVYTLSKSSAVHLIDIVDNYRSGKTHLGELYNQIEYGVRQLENHLLDSKGFLLDLDAAQYHISSDRQPIYSSTLAFDNAYRITLLGIPINESIPLHDHPDMLSVVSVLSGTIHSPIYGISRDSGNHLVELKSCSDRIYTEGEIAILTPDSCNLHGIEALTAKSACLSLQLSMASGLSQQACFFPAGPKNVESECSLWFRMPLRSYSDGA